MALAGRRVRSFWGGIAESRWGNRLSAYLLPKSSNNHAERARNRAETPPKEPGANRLTVGAGSSQEGGGPPVELGGALPDALRHFDPVSAPSFGQVEGTVGRS